MINWKVNSSDEDKPMEPTEEVIFFFGGLLQILYKESVCGDSDI
jgi:hypothetical protein